MTRLGLPCPEIRSLTLYLLFLVQICTHAKNLWAKYNAIAKEHNQKVNWITVAKELGIHVKVREKYSRMVRVAYGVLGNDNDAVG